MPKQRETPAFLFYPDDFSCDGKVEAMTTEEVGAYILLLCKAWRESPAGSIPNDDAVLARWTRLAPDRWAECKPKVLAAFSLGTDSRWHQSRMRKEYETLMISRKKKITAGIKGALSRWSSGEDDGNRIAIASQPHTVPIGNGNGVSPPTEIRTSRLLPDSEREAVEWASMVGVPPDFAGHVFNQLAGRGWLDGVGLPVTDWKRHIRSRWVRQEAEWKKKGKRKDQPI